MTARQHHDLPQCYLKGFAHHRDKPRLFVIDGKTGRTFTSHPRNLAQERDFHRVDVEGLAPDAIENALAQVEGEIAPALERIARTARRTEGDDRALLLTLVALSAVKNPQRREAMRDFQERVGKQVMQLALADKARWEGQVQQMKDAGVMAADEPADYEGMKEFVEAGEYRIEMKTDAHLAMELKVFEDVLAMLDKRKWAVLRAPAKSAGFVTSDHPVNLFWSDPKLEKGFYPPGFGLGKTTVLFPVAREVAIMGAFETPADFEADLSPQEVAEVNSQIIAGAERQIFARDGEFNFMAPRSGKMRRGVDLPGEIRARQQRAGAKANEADAVQDPAFGAEPVAEDDG